MKRKCSNIARDISALLHRRRPGKQNVLWSLPADNRNPSAVAAQKIQKYLADCLGVFFSSSSSTETTSTCSISFASCCCSFFLYILCGSIWGVPSDKVVTKAGGNL